MCQTSLDDVPVQGVLRNISWTWVTVVALLAMLGGLSWNWWRATPRLDAEMQGIEHHPIQPMTATPTPYHLATPTPLPPTPTSQLVLTPVTPSPTPTPFIHLVKSGETLLAIAARYDVALQDLMQANGLDEEAARRLRVGQELIIPGSTYTSETTIGEATEIAPTRRVIHTVQPGDTLISIAVQYGADLDAIIAANPGVNPDLIYVSQQIVVPLLPPTSTPTPTFTPTPTSTPGPPLKAPTLLTPADGQVFEGPDASIVLNWATLETLNKGQMYLVEVEVPKQPSIIQHVTHSTSWRMPAELWPNGGEHTFLWRVTIVEQPPDATGDPVTWNRLSPPSPVRHFEWH
jgi:LysM repeat protein